MPVYDNLFVRKDGGRSRFAAKATRGVADWAGRPRFNCGCTCAQRYPSRSAESNRVACRRSEPCTPRSEEHTSELQSRQYLVCRLLLEKKKPTALRTRPPLHMHPGGTSLHDMNSPT